MNSMSLPGVGQESILDIQDSTFCMIHRIAEERYGLNLHCLSEDLVRRRLAGLIRRQLFRSAEDFAHHIATEACDSIVGDLMYLISDPPFRFCLHPGAMHFLIGEGIDYLVDSDRDSESHHLRIWNVGCFSGEETYSYIMALCEGMTQERAFDLVALGTGCSIALLERAQNGLYAQEALEMVSADWISRYFVTHRVGTEKVYEVRPQIRQRVVFTPMALMGQWEELNGEYDLIVCDHIMHYLAPRARHFLAQRLCRYLRRGGLFITQPHLSLPSPLCTAIHPGIYVRF